MQTTISNEFLTVTIDTHGAEVVSVKKIAKVKSLSGRLTLLFGIVILQYCFRGLDDLLMVN